MKCVEGITGSHPSFARLVVGVHRPTYESEGWIAWLTIRVWVFSLRYSRTLKVLYYLDLESNTVKTATHARFDEGMNAPCYPPPNVQSLRNIDGSNTSQLAEMTPISPMSLDVSDDPFDRLDAIERNITCRHPTLGFEISECHIRKRGYVWALLPTQRRRKSAMHDANIIGSFISFDQRHACALRAESVLAALSAGVFKLAHATMVNICIRTRSIYPSAGSGPRTPNPLCPLTNS
jgi:hypothetical protein